MNILVIDGQGGRMGAQLVKAILERYPDVTLTAVGTNSSAAAAMINSGAHHAATGENAVRVGCRRADVIMGPVGIVLADALFGEVTPAMATAVGQSDAARILIPVSRCNTQIAGVGDLSTTTELLEDALKKLSDLLADFSPRSDRPIF